MKTQTKLLIEFLVTTILIALLFWVYKLFTPPPKIVEPVNLAPVYTPDYQDNDSKG